MNKEDYSKYYIQGSDHYLIPKDVFIELFSEMENWREEAKELKKQLEVGEQQYNDLVEEKEILQEQLSIKTLHLEELKLSKRDYTQENILTMQLELKNRQQKEFIEMLEKEILDSKAGSSQQYYAKEHLRLFKEIIGVSND